MISVVWQHSGAQFGVFLVMWIQFFEHNFCGHSQNQHQYFWNSDKLNKFNWFDIQTYFWLWTWHWRYPSTPSKVNFHTQPDS